MKRRYCTAATCVSPSYLTLGEDDAGVCGLEAVLDETIEAVPHPHRTSDATVDLLLFDMFVKTLRGVGDEKAHDRIRSLFCSEGKGLGWVDGASGGSGSIRFDSFTERAHQT